MTTRKLSGAMVLTAALIALTACSTTAEGVPQTTNESTAQSAVNESARSLLPEEIRNDGKLVFGSTANNAPFTMKTGDTMGGMLPELGTEMGAVLGVDVQFEAMAFPGLIPALTAKRVDGIWTLMQATEERETTLEMISYMKNSQSFMTLADAAPVENTEALCSLHLSTVRGGTSQKLLDSIAEDCENEALGRPEISLFDDPAAAQTQLRSGRVDAFAGITVPVRYIADTVENGSLFTVAPMEYLGGAQAIALTKGDTDLAAALRAAFKVVIDSGRYKEILTKYGAENETFTAEQIVLNPATSGVLDDVVRTESK